MKPPVSIAALLAALMMLPACGKLAEKATEKLAEKAIESESKDGTKASVDISANGAKMTTTDASGKSSTMELGGTKVSESDLGLPFYPGSKIQEGGSSRMVTPESTVVTVNLHSSDASDKVATFYRDKLKSNSQNKKFMDMSTGEGQTTLMLVDDKNKNSIHVNVTKAENSGSDINIVASREITK